MKNHLNANYPIYLDVRTLDHSEFQVSNIQSFDYEGVNFSVTLKDGTVKNLSFLRFSYVGIGEMEDLDLGIHLPETIYMN